jgi:hypothetical protein
MYTRRSYSVEEFAIPLSEGSMGLDVLLDTVDHVRRICADEKVDPEDLGEAHWKVEEWPEPGNPEHLIIRLKTSSIS